MVEIRIIYTWIPIELSYIAKVLSTLYQCILYPMVLVL